MKAVLDIVVTSAVRILMALLLLLPDRMALIIARAVVSFLLLLMPRARSVALRNTEIVCPEKSIEERKQIIRRSFTVLAQHLVDYAKLPKLTKDFKTLQRLQFEDHVAQLRQAQPGVGIMVATMHFGSFELVVQLHAILDKPVAILARAFGLPRLDAWWNIRREMYGCEVFGRKGGYREIERRLRTGQDVAVLFDQNVKANHAIFVSLFGIPAATTKALALAAIRTGCPVYFATSARLIDQSPPGFEFIGKPIPGPLTFPGSKEEQMLAFTEALHREVEATIRKYPEQWFWIHRRFKTRPAGEAEDLYPE